MQLMQTEGISHNDRFAQVRPGMSVWGLDGKIGSVLLVAQNRHTGEPSHLVVRRSFWPWSPRVVMPLHWMRAIENGRITMNVRIWQLQHFAPYRSDREIKRDLVRQIRNTLTFAQAADYLAIGLWVEQNVVLLRGNVRDATRKMQVQALAHQVVGVHEVRNELVADDDLHRRIAQMVAAMPQVAVSALEINVALGAVHIVGTVPSTEQRDRLIAALREVHGVRHIWSHLQIAPTEPHPTTVRPDMQRSHVA
jgi:osmotically-inducible protein OsmY